jgi:hypothetical protein
VTSAENPFFARVQVNRIWFHLLGRGLVDPIDDFRATNPASIPSLLDALANDFVQHRFDLRYLVRLLMNSRTYQLSSEPGPSNAEDETNFARTYIRRLTAEQLVDAQNQVMGLSPSFSGYPVGLRAAQIPGVRAGRTRDLRTTPADRFLEVFGKPPRLLACECERSSETSLSQTFNLISGPAMNELLGAPANRLTHLLGAGSSDESIVDELYWAALTRAPSVEELDSALRHIRAAKDRRVALEDIAWALLNAKEFVLRR